MNTNRRKKILVTGGAGFIGSHLCEKLLNQGHEVTCLDNFFTGTKDNIIHLLDNPYFELVRHDITMPFYIEVDQIYNLACPASPVHYQHNAIKTIKTSVMGAINMLGLAKRTNARILQASTSEVYGDPFIHPQTEDYWGNVNPIGPRSCYDEGKRCAESLFMNYHIQNDVDIKIIRIFNTYGPKMQPNDGRVISNFIFQAVENKDITIYGDGSQSRSFQFVDDLIDAMILMMNTDPSVLGPINIGNPIEYTIKELAQKIVDLTHSKSKIIYLEKPIDDPNQRQPNISTATKTLNGWKPKVELNEGLEKTIAYFKERQ
ncbi:SDR family oxidoreductase [Halosquirtibacter laminarini]|uniref:SDR family oxidoreductase n=1 Tax=Halosquirtibacter laminarini TaxID=3374600 RepID=A0AC61NC06_9BACT|nr:SDR family oxidoreductase [Prolixibacteraceae bacterium]